MLRFLNKGEKEDMQRRGYMYEHLLCLYSMVSDRTALHNENFPVFFNRYGEADVILFGIGGGEGDRLGCVRELTELPINTLNIISPEPIQFTSRVKTRYVDVDYHISVRGFDFELKGGRYRRIRNRLKQIEEMGYQLRTSRDFTSDHIYLLSRHMAQHELDVWDYEELLSLERFFREHDHGMMMEVYRNERLVGFDVVDFFETNGIMVVPLGIYLDAPMLSDFMMHENLKFAKANGYEWIDVGPTCGSEGIRSFKEKWFAQPKYKLYVQTLNTGSLPGREATFPN